MRTGGGDHRLWQPEELELVCARLEYGEIKALTKRLRRSLNAIEQKRAVLRQAAKARRKCGAFLPDNGVPYCVVMMRLLRS